MSDKVFVNGMIVKKPPENAPEFLKCRLSLKIYELQPFLEEHASGDGWVNIDIKESKGGKLYAELNTFKPNSSKPKDADPADVPF